MYDKLFSLFHHLVIIELTRGHNRDRIVITRGRELAHAQDDNSKQDAKAKQR